jgi:DNA repair exonuclease SbcCD ATPase subunit
MAEELLVDRSTFQLVYLSEQGSPQKLMDMEGTELQRFIEKVCGLDKLDAAVKACNRITNDCKQRTEALQPFLLADEDHDSTVSSIRYLEDTLSSEAAKLSAAEQQLSSLASELTNAQAGLVQAIKDNSALKLFEESQKSLLDQLAQTPEMSIIDTSALEDSVGTARSNVAVLTAKLSAIQSYNASLSSITEQLAAIGDKPLVDTSAKEADYASVKAEYASLQEQARAYDTLSKEVTLLASEEAKLILALEGKEPLIVRDDTAAKAEATACGEKLAVAVANLNSIKAALKGSACPTCKRPFECHDPAVMEQELAAAESVYSNAMAAAQGSKTVAEALVGANNLAQAHNARLATDQQALDKVSAAAQEAATQLASVSRPAPILLVEKAAFITEVEAWLADTRAANAVVAADATRKLKLQAQLDSLVDPGDTEEEALDALATNKGYFDECTTRLRDTQEYNRNATVATHRRSQLLGSLAALEPPAAVRKDVASLEVTCESLRDTHAKANASYFSLNQSVQALKSELLPLRSQLDQHQKALESAQGDFKKIGLASHVSQLMTNSREKFVSDAMAVVFSVASSFVKLSTGGDISDVNFDNGIRYVEDGRSRPKTAASGSQKTLMGLGMKLGIANLVVSDFNALLLDEATADMDEAISLQCNLAMSSMCEQTISISHRKMDTAGNVVELS